MGGFCLLVELHRERSALRPAQKACLGLKPTLVYALCLQWNSAYINLTSTQCTVYSIYCEFYNLQLWNITCTVERVQYTGSLHIVWEPLLQCRVAPNSWATLRLKSQVTKALFHTSPLWIQPSVTQSLCHLSPLSSKLSVTQALYHPNPLSPKSSVTQALCHSSPLSLKPSVTQALYLPSLLSTKPSVIQTPCYPSPFTLFTFRKPMRHLFEAEFPSCENHIS